MGNPLVPPGLIYTARVSFFSNAAASEAGCLQHSPASVFCYKPFLENALASLQARLQPLLLINLLV